MKVLKLERIVKTYYDALEDGVVLGRKCTSCGHIEFPPYLACNECGNLDTEWVDLTNTRAHITQILQPLKVFPERDFKEAHGGYIPIAVKIDNADPYDTSLVHVDEEKYQELHDNLENVIVKPCIVQDADTKICLWVLEDYVPEEAPASELKEIEIESEKTIQASEDVVDDVAKVVFECVAEIYEVEKERISFDTDIREDLGNQSLKMLVVLSELTEKLGVYIDITQAGELNTIGEFVAAVREEMSK